MLLIGREKLWFPQVERLRILEVLIKVLAQNHLRENRRLLMGLEGVLREVRILRLRHDLRETDPSVWHWLLILLLYHEDGIPFSRRNVVAHLAKILVVTLKI